MSRKAQEREWSRTRWDVLRARGECARCGKVMPLARFTKCLTCRIKHAEVMQANRRKA